MNYLYHGHVCRALATAFLPLAEAIQELDGLAPATQAPAPSQMALTALSERVQNAPPAVRGHAGLPGSGPIGQTCGTCASIVRKAAAGKPFFKCHLTASKWTGGSATDLRAKDQACNQWKKDFRAS